MNKRQFKKTHCLVSHKGYSMHFNSVVPRRQRKAARAWIRSIVTRPDLMEYIRLKSKYGIDLLEMTEKEMMLKIAKEVALSKGWREGIYDSNTYQ